LKLGAVLILAAPIFRFGREAPDMAVPELEKSTHAFSCVPVGQMIGLTCLKCRSLKDQLPKTDQLLLKFTSLPVAQNIDSFRVMASQDYNEPREDRRAINSPKKVEFSPDVSYLAGISTHGTDEAGSVSSPDRDESQVSTPDTTFDEDNRRTNIPENEDDLSAQAEQTDQRTISTEYGTLKPTTLPGVGDVCSEDPAEQSATLCDLNYNQRTPSNLALASEECLGEILQDGRDKDKCSNADADLATVVNLCSTSIDQARLEQKPSIPILNIMGYNAETATVKGEFGITSSHQSKEVDFPRLPEQIDPPSQRHKTIEEKDIDLMVSS
jgi:hypothetical protein